MARTYSLDLRERVMQAYDDGVPIDDLTLQYRVSRSWIYSLIKQRRETNSIAPRVYRHGKQSKLTPYEQEVRQMIADHPDATLSEFCALMSDHVSVGTTTMCRYLHHLKITRKKKLSVLPNNNVQKLSKSVTSGKNCKQHSPSKNSFSSMKPGRKRI